MFTKLASITAAAAFAFAGVALSAGTAEAGAVEYFKCSMAEGKTMDDFVAIGADFHAALAEAGIENYTVSYLSPLFSGDISRGTFWWVGSADSMATIGAINDFWESDANEAVRTAWGEATSDCEVASAHYSTQVE